MPVIELLLSNDLRYFPGGLNLCQTNKQIKERVNEQGKKNNE